MMYVLLLDDEHFLFTYELTFLGASVAREWVEDSFEASFGFNSVANSYLIR